MIQLALRMLSSCGFYLLFETHIKEKGKLENILNILANVIILGGHINAKVFVLNDKSVSVFSIRCN